VNVGQLIELLGRVPPECHALPVCSEHDGVHTPIVFVVVDPTAVTGRPVGGVYLVHGGDEYVRRLGLVKRYVAPADACERVTCPRCKGYRVIYTPDRNEHPFERECPHCTGFGWVRPDGRPPLDGVPEGTP